MVIKSLIRYKKRVRYQLTAHPLFIFYGFFVSFLSYGFFVSFLSYGFL